MFTHSKLIVTILAYYFLSLFHSFSKSMLRTRTNCRYPHRSAKFQVKCHYNRRNCCPNTYATLPPLVAQPPLRQPQLHPSQRHRPRRRIDVVHRHRTANVRSVRPVRPIDRPPVRHFTSHKRPLRIRSVFPSMPWPHHLPPPYANIIRHCCKCISRKAIRSTPVIRPRPTSPPVRHFARLPPAV